MSSNQIFRTKLVGKIVKGGTEIVIAAATETELWKRPDFIAEERAPGFIKAVEEDPKPLPKGTAKVIMRQVAIIQMEDRSLIKFTGRANTRVTMTQGTTTLELLWTKTESTFRPCTSRKKVKIQNRGKKGGCCGYHTVIVTNISRSNSPELNH